MKLADLNLLPPTVRGPLLLAGSSLLSACGAGDTGFSPSVTSAALQADTQVSADLSTLSAQPTFHVAPVLLDEPDDTDTLVSDVSAVMEPHTAWVSSAMSHLSTRRLTRDAIESATYAPPSVSIQSLPSPDGAAATPLASGSIVATYTPAQVRAAYGMPSLSATGANQAAQLGAGQTIYLIDAMHNPNVAAELGAFNQKFGLPTCSVMPIATSASLPLAPAATTGCTLSVVYSTANATMTASAPAYDSGWSTEISIDVQWAHATAPLARLVLIEAPDASLTSLSAAIRLADALGAGVVSMSFGAGEGSWTASMDNAFATAGMTYVASTGDAGPQVNWPAVSSRVLAVGGTTLTYSGSSVRREVTWSRTGGGVSLYTPTPSYQTSAVPGMGVPTHRSVADVAFNADPATGQYVAVISQGSPSVGWLSAGGTSLSAPQWAGLLAVANALRAQGASAPLGAPHAMLYGQIASVSGNYSSAFADITQGADGNCLACTAKTGYDLVTGLGTPNVAAILPLLSASSSSATSAPPVAPVVTGANVTGKVGFALSFAVSVTSPDPVIYSLAGAPYSMTINRAGLVTWPRPLAGTYVVTASATDPTTGLTGRGIYKVTIAR